jgi:hypothetical protein
VSPLSHFGKQHGGHSIAVMGELWCPDPGTWLAEVTLDGRSGLTLVQIGPDYSVRVLGPAGGVYLFPSRHGLAAFLASGQWHSLQGRLAGYDPVHEQVEFEADFVELRDGGAAQDEDVKAYQWSTCLLVLNGCGFDDLPSPEAVARQVAAVTTLREDFEQPGYPELDFWLNEEVQPVELTLPSGTGHTLVAATAFWDPDAEAQAFLGDRGEVLMFSSTDDLLAHVRADGPDDMRKAAWWPVDPPHCRPELFVDVREADPHDPDSDAYEYLRALAGVLTGRERDLPFIRPVWLMMGRVEDRVLDVMMEVDSRITWR